MDGIFYAPLDFVFVIRRVLRKLQPRVVVVAETEIWPNLFRETARAGCGLIVVNGRISDEAAPRYLKWRWFFRHALQWPDAILAQNAEIRERFIAVGAPPDKVAVGGNLKYDFQPGSPPADVESFLDELQPSAVWIAASTMPPDEDDTVIAAFQELAARIPGLLLMLAPRKPERFDLVARKLDEAGMRWVRRSALSLGRSGTRPTGVMLLDSIGELSGLFSRADVVFMGGTLVDSGGHNILEPAMFGKPIVVGPHMENFRDIAGGVSNSWRAGRNRIGRGARRRGGHAACRPGAGSRAGPSGQGMLGSAAWSNCHGGRADTENLRRRRASLFSCAAGACAAAHFSLGRG